MKRSCAEFRVEPRFAYPERVQALEVQSAYTLQEQEPHDAPGSRVNVARCPVRVLQADSIPDKAVVSSPAILWALGASRAECASDIVN